jgi:hypothetical protein
MILSQIRETRQGYIATSTRSGWRSWGLRSSALISAAVRPMLRPRPARRSAAAIRLTDSLVASAGVGAIRCAPWCVARSRPDGAGQHRDRPTQYSIGRQPAVQVGVHPKNVGQGHRVGMIGLRPRYRVAFPVAGQRQDLLC